MPHAVTPVSNEADRVCFYANKQKGASIGAGAFCISNLSA